MIWLTVTAILGVFTWMMWRRYSEFNHRQLLICQTALTGLIAKARAAGESEENVEILINLAIDTYNESLRGPWFYTDGWKIPQQEFEGKRNEIKRHSERGHPDSEIDFEERQE